MQPGKIDLANTRMRYQMRVQRIHPHEKAQPSLDEYVNEPIQITRVGYKPILRAN